MAGRYIARPAVAESRLSINEQGDVVYTFKKPWDDGTTAIKMTPLEMMERLAALVPRPRVHLTRFHGVLGPHYKYRKLIVPKKKTELALVAGADDTVQPADSDKPSASTKRIAWAQLLKRVFNIDVTVCSRCKGKVKIISAIEDPKVIKKILNHMRLPSSAPKLAPARGPPASDQHDIPTHEFFENELGRHTQILSASAELYLEQSLSRKNLSTNHIFKLKYANPIEICLNPQPISAEIS